MISKDDIIRSQEKKIKQLLDDKQRLRELLNEIASLAGSIINRERLTFAECSDAEEIIGLAKKIREKALEEK